MNAIFTPPPAEHTTLYYREGSSDKVYQVSLEPQGELFAVNFAYGRRGSTLNSGTKTSSPVDYGTAKQVYDQLVREKQSKGYTVGPEGTPYQHGGKETRTTGLLPQLLNPVEEHEAKRLIEAPTFCAQEKYDGKRMMIRKSGAEIHGINRKGLVVGLPEPVLQAAQAIPGDFVLDGESVGDVFYAFDMIDGLGLNNLRWRPYQDRLTVLMNLLALAMQRQIRFAETAFTRSQKQDLLALLKQNRREGMVFKELNAPYTPGRPNSGGAQLKHKFYATLSAVVAGHNARHSVELRLLNGQGWVSVGNVTIPSNQPLPRVGDIIDARYLYAYPGSNALYQPVYLGRRSDVDPHGCCLSQLKYKADPEEEEP